jgi:hypothetical protein
MTPPLTPLMAFMPLQVWRSCKVTDTETDGAFGHAGAVVGASSSPSSSRDPIFAFSAARLTLQRDIENPGPFSEVSKAPQ